MVERATGPLWRATRPALFALAVTNGLVREFPVASSAASCRRERPSWPFHPYPSASFRLEHFLIKLSHTLRGGRSGRSALGVKVVRAAAVARTRWSQSRAAAARKKAFNLAKASQGRRIKFLGDGVGNLG